MKKFFFTYLFIIFCFFLENSYAKENIVFLDLDYILLNSNKGKAILSELETLNKENLKKMKIKEDSIKKEEQEIISQKKIISEEIYSEKVRNLKKKIEIFRKDKNELAKKFTNEREKKINNFFQIINKILANYVEKNSIDLVLNKKDILIGKNEYNITNDILEIVNKLD